MRSMLVSPADSLRYLLRLALICCAVLATLLALAPTTYGHALSGCSNPDVTGGGSCSEGPVQLSPQQQSLLAAKTRVATDLAGVRLGRVSAAQYRHDLLVYVMSLPEPFRSAALKRVQAQTLAPTPNCISPCEPSSYSLDLIQQPQQESYYCGPATASEILTTLGPAYSQSYLGGSYSSPTLLGTNYYKQTTWGPAVMAPTLNYLQSGYYYQTVQGSSNWGSDLVSDIYTWHQPLAANTVEQEGGPYLTGHQYAPANQFPLYHWIAVYGYTSYGAGSTYADSISGDTKYWPWAQYVPAYSTISSSTIETLVSSRGFVW